MDKRLLTFSFYGIDVHLGECFYQGIANRPPRWHSHPCYELVCVDQGTEMVFVINPPLLEHLSVDAPGETVHSLIFAISPRDHHPLFDRLLPLTEPITLTDQFDGAARIRSIKRLTGDSRLYAMEQIEAELRLLFVGLARSLGSCQEECLKKRNLLDRERLVRLEEYFNIHLKSPDCSKRELADELGVCERQLTRILQRVYGSSFSAILLRSRMTLAEAMRQQGRTIEEIIAAIGYNAPSSFRRAYCRFFGHPFVACANQDILTSEDVLS